MKQKLLIVLIISILVSFTYIAEAQDQIDWWKIKQDVTNTLNEEDLVELALDYRQEKLPSELKELLIRLNVFIRAGLREDAQQILDAIAQERKEPQKNEFMYILHRYDLYPNEDIYGRVGHFLIEREEWDLAKHFLEKMPEAKSGIFYALIKHWIESGVPHEQIDSWLENQTKKVPSIWFPARVYFYNTMGSADELMNQMKAKIVAQPTETKKVLIYLKAIIHAGAMDLNWIGDVYQPESTIDAYYIGNKILSWNAHKGAIRLFQYSLNTPLTEKEIEYLRYSSQVMLSAEEAKVRFRLGCMEQLAKALKEAGEVEQAQSLVEEVLKEKEEHNLPLHGFATLAGGTQMASGARTVETHILDKEEKEKDSAEYWLERANYYIGREEQEKAIEAFNKGLELAEAKISQSKMTDIRKNIISRYWRYMVKIGRVDEVIPLLENEIKTAHPDNGSARQAVWAFIHLQQDHLYEINHEDDWLWDYLINQRDRFDDRLLRYLYKNAPEEKNRTMFDKIEESLKNAEPQKAKDFISFLTTYGFPGRAIRIYESMKDEERKHHRNHSIFRCYLMLNDWKGAELFAKQSGMIGLDTYEKLALEATKTHEYKDALRVWRKASNYDLAFLTPLYTLGKTGLKHNLMNYYISLQQRLPQSWIPQQAIQILKES